MGNANNIIKTLDYDLDNPNSEEKLQSEDIIFYNKIKSQYSDIKTFFIKIFFKYINASQISNKYFRLIPFKYDINEIVTNKLSKFCYNIKTSVDNITRIIKLSVQLHHIIRVLKLDKTPYIVSITKAPGNIDSFYLVVSFVKNTPQIYEANESNKVNETTISSQSTPFYDNLPIASPVSLVLL
jgi:hypothetical protein